MDGILLSHGKPAIAVGVSGGCDSMALVLLADLWAKSHGAEVLAITVDHGLRKNSAIEAEQVGTWLKARGINHKIIKWENGMSQLGGVQARARVARYGLMADVCKKSAIKHLLVAHNIEDQAETFLMRLAHKSGLDGLSAMARQRALENTDITIVRPLLGIGKARLKETLKLAGQPWIEDPSNRDTKFERVRTRKLLAQLETVEGITPANIAGAANGARGIRDALESASQLFIESHVSNGGSLYGGSLYGPAARLNIAEFLDLPVEIQGRVLSTIITQTRSRATNGGYRPASDKISRIIARLGEEPTHEQGFKARTLGGCKISLKRGVLTIKPEPMRAKPRVPTDGSMVNNVTHDNYSQKYM